MNYNTTKQCQDDYPDPSMLWLRIPITFKWPMQNLMY